MTTFEQFNFQEPINRALLSMGFSEPTEIQKKAIPKLMAGGEDFVGQAQTGTGKTAAFLLPLIETLDFDEKAVQALVLTPTRELAKQVDQQLEKLAQYLPLKSLTIYGGTSYDTQIRALKKGRVNVVVGTPGRILDLIDRGSLQLGKCNHFIIDEADEMLNMGFLEDVESIMQCLPEEKRIWMFSATMPEPIKKLVKRNFSNPSFVKTQSKVLTNDDVEQLYIMLDRRDHVKGLRRFVESDPESQGIVFCETRAECKNVSEKLIDFGVSALPLHGDLSQSQREYAMARFKANKVQFLVCTDIAARGIDVQDLKYVFNMGFPRQDDSYVHRIGRTGRAGAEGKAITFVDSREKFRIRHLEKMTGQKMEPCELPTDTDLKKARVQAEIQKLESLKEAIVRLGEDFTVDETYSLYEESLAELSRDQLLKLFFSQRFNKDFRMVEELLKIKKEKPVKAGKLRHRGRDKGGESRRVRATGEGRRGRSEGEGRRSRSEGEGRRERVMGRSSRSTGKSRSKRR